MTEQSQLERAARALALELSKGEKSPGQWFIEGGLYSDEMLKGIARAVLMAVREPSEAMLVAGAKCRTSPERFAETYPDETMKPEWQAMIDASLSEKSK